MSRRSRGFTLIEVLVAVLLFALGVVGLVAIESRSIEAQKASAQIREAERVAQGTMADLVGRGYLELIEVDFENLDNPAFPYDDERMGIVADFRRPPADIPDDEAIPGAIRNQFRVIREVDWVIDPDDPPGNPPLLGTDERRIQALMLDVTVLWIDDSNPAFPPPASAKVADLTRAMIDPSDADFRPYVGHVRLRTVRANDAVLIEGGTGG